MLNIYLYLYILLDLHNALLITCEHVKLTSTNYTRPTRRDTVNNLVWDPHHKPISANLDRKKRVSHHGSKHHHIQKVSLHLLNGKSTSKPIVVHHFNQKKDRSQQLDCNKRHVAFEQYAKKINQTINGTEEDRRFSKYVCASQSVTTSVNDYKLAVSKRNGIPNPILTTAPTSVMSGGKALVAPSTTVKSINITPLSPRITTKSVLTTTTVNVQSSESTISKLDLLKSLADNGQISGIYSGPDGRTVMTKVFIIPIQERLPTITRFKIRSDNNKTAKRRESKSRKSKKKNDISKVSKRRPKHASKQKKNKKRKKGTGKLSKKGRNKNKKKRKQVKRKKRLKIKRKFEKNKRKTLKKGASHKDSKIKSYRKIKGLTKQEEDVQACRKDKTKDSHKSLKKKKRNKLCHKTGDHLSKVTKKIRRVQVSEKESNHGTDINPNKNENYSKRYSKVRQEENQNLQTKRKVNDKTAAHKDLEKKEVPQVKTKDIHELEEEDKVISHIDTCSDKKKEELEKNQKLIKATNESLQKKRKGNDKATSYKNKEKKEIQKNRKKSLHEMERNIISNTEILSQKKKNDLEGYRKLMTEKNLSLERNRKENKNDISLRNKEVQTSEKKSTNQMKKEKKVVSHTQISSDQKKNNLEVHQNLIKEGNKNSHRELTDSVSETAQDNVEKKSTDRMIKEKKIGSNAQICSDQKKNNLEVRQKQIKESNKSPQRKLADNCPNIALDNLEKKGTHEPEAEEKIVAKKKSTDQMQKKTKIVSHPQISSQQKKNNLKEDHKLIKESNEDPQRKLTDNGQEIAQDTLENKNTYEPENEEKREEKEKSTDQMEKDEKIVCHTQIHSDKKENILEDRQKLIKESNEGLPRKLTDNDPETAQDNVEKKSTCESEEQKLRVPKEESTNQMEKRKKSVSYTQIRPDQKKNNLEEYQKLIKENNERPQRKLTDNVLMNRKSTHEPERDKSFDRMEKQKKIVSYTQIRSDQKKNNLEEHQKLIKECNDGRQSKLIDNGKEIVQNNLERKNTYEPEKEEKREEKEKSTDRMENEEKIISYTRIHLDQKKNILEDHQKLIKESNTGPPRKLADNVPETAQDNLAKESTYEPEKEEKRKEKETSTGRMEKEEKIVFHTQINSDQKKNILEDCQKVIKESNEGPPRKLTDIGSETAQDNLEKKSTYEPEKEELRVPTEESTDRIEKRKKIASHTHIRPDQKKNNLEDHQKLIEESNEGPPRKLTDNGSEIAQDNLEKKSTYEPEKEEKRKEKVKSIDRMEKEEKNTQVHSDRNINILEDHQKLIKESNEGPPRKLTNNGSETAQDNLEKKSTYEPEKEELRVPTEESTDRIEKKKKIVSHTQIRPDQKENNLEDHQKLIKESNEGPPRKLTDNGPGTAQDDLEKKSTHELEKEEQRVGIEKSADGMKKKKEIISQTQIRPDQKRNNLGEHEGRIEERNESPQRKLTDNGVKADLDNLEQKNTYEPEKAENKIEKKKSSNRIEKQNTIVSYTQTRSGQKKNILEDHHKLIKESNEGPPRKLTDNDSETAQDDFEKKSTYKPETEELRVPTEKSTDRIEKRKKIVSHTQIRPDQKENNLEDHQKLIKESNEGPPRKLTDNGPGTAQDDLEKKSTHELEKEEQIVGIEKSADRMKKKKEIISQTQIRPDQKRNNLGEHEGRIEERNESPQRKLTDNGLKADLDNLEQKNTYEPEKEENKIEKKKSSNRIEKQNKIVSYTQTRSGQKRNILEDHHKLIKESNEGTPRKLTDNDSETAQDDLEKKSTYKPEKEELRVPKEESTSQMEKRKKIVSHTQIRLDQKENNIEDHQQLITESNEGPPRKLKDNGPGTAQTNLIKKSTQEPEKEEKKVEKEKITDRMEKENKFVPYSQICSDQKTNNLKEHQKLITETNKGLQLIDNSQEITQNNLEKKNTYEPEKEEAEQEEEKSTDRMEKENEILSHTLIRSDQRKNELEEHQELTTKETEVLQRKRKQNNDILNINMEDKEVQKKGNKKITNEMENEKAIVSHIEPRSYEKEKNLEGHQKLKKEQKRLDSKGKHNDKETIPFNIEKKEINKEKKKSTNRMDKEKETVCRTEGDYLKRYKDLDGHQMLRNEDDVTSHRKSKGDDNEISYKSLEKKEVHKDKKKITHGTVKDKKIVSLVETRSKQKEKYLESHQNLTKKKNEILKNKRKNYDKENHTHLENKVVKKEQNEMGKENITILHTHSSRKKKDVDEYQDIPREENECLHIKHEDKNRAITHKKLAKKINEARKQLNKETKKYETVQENNKKALQEQHKEKKVISHTPPSEYTENLREYQNRSRR